MQEQLLEEKPVEAITESPIEESNSTTQEINPEIEAIMFLKGALPAFRRDLDGVTGVQAKRVLSALMESPLEHETPEFTTKEANALFELGVKITNAKFILFNVAVRNDEIRKTVKEAAENADKTQGEEVNV